MIINTQNSCTATQAVEIQISLSTQEPNTVINAGCSECPNPRMAPPLTSYAEVNSSNVVAITGIATHLM